MISILKRYYYQKRSKKNQLNNFNNSIIQYLENDNIKIIKRPINFEDKIEILIPCYNHAQYLLSAYQSIENQTWHAIPITITFIDDNSTDNTQGVINTIMKKNNSRFVINNIHNKINLRQWASLNKAIEQSDNKLFIILNDDDMLVSDALEKIINTYKKYPDIMMLGAHSLWFDNDKSLPQHKVLNIDQIQLTIHSPHQVKDYQTLNDLNMTHSSSSFFKAAWKAVGGYKSKEERIDQSANEDRDFQLRVNAAAPVGVYYNYPLAYWRTDSSHGKDY